MGCWTGQSMKAFYFLYSNKRYSNKRCFISNHWFHACMVLVIVTMKVSKRSSIGRMDERTFFLFSDILMYAKPRLLDGATSGAVRAWGGVGNRSSSSPSLVCCCIMPLHHCRVQRVFGQRHGTDNAGTLFSVWQQNINILYTVAY